MAKRDKTKTNHQIGYRKKQKNPTTNFAPATHAQFCARCLAHNGKCLVSGRKVPSKQCNA